MGWATLKTDLPTSYGTYDKGLQVKVWHITGKTAVICLDPYSPHPGGKCHSYQIPVEQLHIFKSE